MITFLDIPGRSEIPYSPNTWKVRLALNLKDIPYETLNVEIVDIETTCKSLGVPPSGTKPTGEPHYTLPAIIDSNSPPGETIQMSDSRPIIEYLDRKYPSNNGTTLFPPDLDDFQNKVQDIVNLRILAQSPFLWLLDLHRVKTPRDQENIKMRMEARFGKPMSKILAEGDDWQRHWAEVRQGFSEIDRLVRSTAGKSDGPFLLGQRVLYADVVVCALLLCLKACISDVEWNQIASWNGGRWGRLLDEIQPWIRARGYRRWTG